MKNVKVDKDKCIGCGSCSSVCPDVFAMKDGKVEVIGEPDGHEDEVKMATDVCPTQAISFEK